MVPLRDRRRGAFTAVELAVVISIAMMLMAMTVPAVMRSIRRSQLQQAQAEIQSVASQARQLAIRAHVGTGTDRYGVVIYRETSGGRLSVAIIRGNATSGLRNLVLCPDGSTPLLTRRLPRIVTLLASCPGLANPNPTATLSEVSDEIGWYFADRTGNPCWPDGGGWRDLVGVGTADYPENEIVHFSGGTTFRWYSPVADRLHLTTLDQLGKPEAERWGVAVSVQGTGLFHSRTCGP